MTPFAAMTLAIVLTSAACGVAGFVADAQGRRENTVVAFWLGFVVSATSFVLFDLIRAVTELHR